MPKYNEFLVFINLPLMVDDDNPCDVFHKIMTANEIFNRMDMDDCSGESIEKIYLLKDSSKNKLIPCEFHGTWHNPNNPLQMTITAKGKTIAYGYGTNH